MSFLVIIFLAFSIIFGLKQELLVGFVPIPAVLLFLLLLELCGVPYSVIWIVYSGIMASYFYLLNKE